MAAPLALLADRAVAHVMAVTDDEEVLFAGVLEAMGTALACRYGAVWEPETDDGRIACVETWVASGFEATEFEAATRLHRFDMGAGLPGRVMASGEPEWISDVGLDPNFPRASAAASAGLVSAFCFPLHSARGVLGAVELYTTDARMPDTELLAAMESVGGQLGQFLVRRRAERSVRESDARKSAIMAAALDCVITIDHRGNILEFNRAAERTFGYSSEEVVGREMGELIVPPSLRERHRRGLLRYLETEQEQVIGRRIEITGMRKDGTEFPVELAITRIDLPGEPMFTGHLRDITERKRTESELRASRARIVAAADAERRRIERDLHDGAQQRLVNLGLILQIARSRLVNGQLDVGLETIDEAIVELTGATAELRELARGIHPAVLSDGGLAPALSALVERSQPRAKLQGAPSQRMPAAVEAAAYFVVAEALTNATRHASAETLDVMAELRDGWLEVEVRDDGVGGADAGEGSGLRGLVDRVAAIGGELEITSAPGEGTVVRARIPCE